MLSFRHGQDRFKFYGIDLHQVAFLHMALDDLPVDLHGPVDLVAAALRELLEVAAREERLGVFRQDFRPFAVD